MPSLVYIVGIGGPFVAWASIAWLLIRAAGPSARGRRRRSRAEQAVSAQPGARARR